MQRFTVSAAVLPSTGRKLWLVLDREQADAIVGEVRDFGMYLAGADKSENTIRSYVPKVAMFLNWADSMGLDWRTITLPQMAKFKWAMEAPLPRKSTGHRSEFARAPRTINLILTAVLEFLRYCTRQGSLDPRVVARLVEPRYVSHVPSGFDPGERGQFRFSRVKEIRAREVETPPKTLTRDQVGAILEATSNARDHFLLLLLDETAIRIGEALGLRRSDMHFLPDSTSLGCEVAGAHIHVIRRTDNANGALAKRRRARHVPVLDHVVTAYRDYQVAREASCGSAESDHVFVNVSAGILGSPMTYNAVVGLTHRVGRRAGVANLHPHLFRHTTATRWIDEGVSPDVVQELLGHASPSSTAIYTHTSNAKLRAAVASGAGRMSAPHGLVGTSVEVAR